jgi:membrane protein
MARLRDFPRALRIAGPIRFTTSIWREIGEDNLYTLAAAVAYAWLFAVFPFLIFLLTLTAYVPEHKKIEATKYVHDALHRIMTDDAADTIESNVKAVLDQPKTGLLSLGLAVTLYIASGGMAMTMSTLDAAYDVPSARPFYIQRPLALLLTVVLATLILIVFVLLPVGTAWTYWLEKNHVLPDASHLLLTVLRYVVSVLLLFLILALLYKFAPNVKQKFTFLSPGAVFTILVWFLLAWIFRFYINRFSHYDKTYGALGGVAIVLLFFYVDALVLLIGAEINHEVEKTTASQKAGS